ncbi:MAG: trypsin-like peptidase domain-containing protein, partial [Chloroflexi bacterium]|nr:trypsin-like peptidase domain-containing protein [Chloroflexota bacterium]
MDRQNKGVGCRTLLLVVVLALFMGALAGGAAGGALGYYVAQQSPAPSAAVVTQPSASSLPITEVAAVKTDSAIVDAVKKAKPAVVTVVNTLQPQRVPSIFGQPRTRQGQAMGTGVIIDQQGHIITNDHVIQGAQKLEVVFDNGDKSEAKLVGTDPFSDLAVLQVAGKPMPAVAELGDSSSLQLGEPVIAIGSALGDLKDTVTLGVVSGLNRQMQANNSSLVEGEGLIQTDAAINHGNSGGPLVNVRGQIIGINELVVTSSPNGDVAQGLGFAIPANTLKRVAAQLMQNGKVSHPFLGVTYQTLTPQLAAANDLSL